MITITERKPLSMTDLLQFEFMRNALYAALLCSADAEYAKFTKYNCEHSKHNKNDAKLTFQE